MSQRGWWEADFLSSDSFEMYKNTQELSIFFCENERATHSRTAIGQGVKYIAHRSDLAYRTIPSGLSVGSWLPEVGWCHQWGMACYRLWGLWTPLDIAISVRGLSDGYADIALAYPAAAHSLKPLLLPPMNHADAHSPPTNTAIHSPTD